MAAENYFFPILTWPIRYPVSLLPPPERGRVRGRQEQPMRFRVLRSLPSPSPTRRPQRTALLLVFPILIAAPALAGDFEHGKIISARCVACHGVDGATNNPMIPKLAGQNG